MLEQLFGSKTRLKLLRILYRDPDKTFFVRELSRSIDSQINAVRREIDLLIKIGLLKEVAKTKAEKVAKDKTGASGYSLRKYYQLDRESIIFSELRALLLKENLLGEQRFIKDMREKGGDIKILLLTGKFTADKKAPIDVLVVGDLDEKAINRLILNYEKDFGASIRFTMMTEKEFVDRRYVMDKFLFTIFEAIHIKVIDKIKTK